jgi:glycosyltransferase involved in cell wall biosynthesis
MVFSSECEQRHTVRPARNRTREVVIPDLFEADRPLLDGMEPAAVETRFGFMAEIAPRKGLVPLIRGFVEFASALGPKDRLRLTVGGSVRRGAEAYFAEARALAAKAPEYAPIEFIGAVSHADRSAFYCATDIFLVPSHFESFGLTVLEGLTAGCAEVVGPHVGVLEFLPADSGLEIARKVSPAAIATALRAQFERVQGQRRSDRTAAASGACEAIAKMNSLATDRWLALLAS